MSIAPLDMQLYIDRLQSMTGVTRVGGAVDLAAVDQTAPPAPSCWVLAVKDKPIVDASGSAQKRILIQSTIGVLLIVSSMAGVRGDAAREPVRALRAQLWQQLIGWTPIGVNAQGATELTGGQLQHYDSRNRMVRWVETFQLRWRLVY